jgi:Bacteriophage Lambda NinG protein
LVEFCARWYAFSLCLAHRLTSLHAILCLGEYPHKNPNSVKNLTPLRKKSQSPLAIAHDNLWTAFSWMTWDDGDWTCFKRGTRIDPKAKDERNISMVFYMHVGHYKPQGLFKSIKYDPLNVRPQCVGCNKWLHGNLAAYSLASKSFLASGFCRRSNAEPSSISITRFRFSKR